MGIKLNRGHLHHNRLLGHRDGPRIGVEPVFIDAIPRDKPPLPGFAESEYDEAIEECDDVLDARLDLCEALDDAVHEPRFGSAYAADFVDPRAIGGAVAPNPYFPLVAGNRWVYEGGDATITRYRSCGARCC